MPVYVSASSRLHTLLTALMALPGGQTLRASWSQGLGIPEREVQFGAFGLPLVAMLVDHAEAEATHADERWGLPLRRRHVQEWSQPVFARGGNLENPRQNHLVSPEALDYLDNVANVLRKNEHHEALPEGDELTSLLGQVDELTESIGSSDDLPDDVKQALVRRLIQLRYTIENVRVGGPEGVQEAVELLVGTLAIRSGRNVPRPTVDRILALGRTIWKVFAIGAGIDSAMAGWLGVGERLGLASGDADEASGAVTDEP